MQPGPGEKVFPGQQQVLRSHRRDDTLAGLIGAIEPPRVYAIIAHMGCCYWVERGGASLCVWTGVCLLAVTSTPLLCRRC